MSAARWHPADTPSPNPHSRAAGEATGEDVIRVSPLQRSLIIEATPPSLNVIAGRGSRFAFARAKRRWQSDLEVALMQRAIPRDLAYVNASALLVFPTRRRRDEGNYRSLIEKSLGDALVNGRWLADDTPDYFRFGAVEFGLGHRRTVVRLEFEPR